MVNNQFSLIGTAITRIEVVNNANVEVKQYVFKIEVDRYNSKPYVLNIYFYDNNRSINPNMKVEGRLIAISGVLEGYNSKSGINYTRCVANSIYFPTKSKDGYNANNGSNSGELPF